MEWGVFPGEVAMPEKTHVEITETSEPPAKAGFQADLQDRKLMRVYLERIEVKFNGDSPKVKSPDKDNLIIAQLVYPRSGAPNILSTTLFAPTNLRKKPKGPIMIRKGDKNGSISLRLEF